MTKYIILLAALPLTSVAQSAKRDTIKGVVVYTGHSNLRNLPQGNYHTYTVEATEIRTDTGVISIQTEGGYLDLKKDYRFIPMNRVQSARLKSKP
jgi:hypothetical protein